MAGESLGEVIQRLDRFGGLQAELAQGDAQLLDRFSRRRDEPAFAALMVRHGPMVLGVCRRLLADARDAEDAFQACFLVLARRAGAIPRQTPVGSWLYGVAWRVAMRLRGRALRRRAHERIGVDLEAWVTDAPPSSDIQLVVHEEVRRLPEKYRTVVVLCCLEERSNEEVAGLLRRPIGTVKSRLARARDLLRSRLSRRGLALSVGLLTAALEVRTAQAAPAAADAGTAARFAAGDQLAGGASARAAVLARGVLRAAATAKLTGAAAALAVCLLALVMLWLARPGSRSAAAGRPDAEAIQGAWQLTEVDASGLDELLQPEIVALLRKSQWRFSADTLVVHGEKGEAEPVPYLLDSTRTPKALSVMRPDGTCMAVYALNGDELTIRLAPPGSPVHLDDLRPGSGDGTMRLTFRREK